MDLKRALVIGHTDGHGIAATAVSMMNLEKEAFQPEKIVKHPETNFPPKFWNETIKTVDPTQYGTIVIVDIPFNRDNFVGCREELRRLGKSARTIYIDHHTPLPGSLEDITKCCEVRMVPSAYRVVYGQPDQYWSVIGAISDRIPMDIENKITDELMNMSFGLDAASRKDAGNAVERILKNEKQYFLEMAKIVPEPENYETKGNFVLIKGNVPEGWKLKSMDKAMRKTGCDYALFLSENVPDQQNTGQNADFLTVAKYWLSKIPGTANDLLPEQIKGLAFGHPNARIVKLSVGEGRKYLQMIYGN